MNLGLPAGYGVAHYNQATPQDRKNNNSPVQETVFGRRFNTIPSGKGTSLNHLDNTISDCQGLRDVEPDSTPQRPTATQNGFRR